MVATYLINSYRAGLSPALDHATRVADPFHVTRVGNRAGRDRSLLRGRTLTASWIGR